MKALDLFMALVREQKADVIVIDEAQRMLQDREYLRLKELLEVAKEYGVAIVLVLQDILAFVDDDKEFFEHFPQVLHFRSIRIPELRLNRGEAVFFERESKSQAKVTYKVNER